VSVGFWKVRLLGKLLDTTETLTAGLDLEPTPDFVAQMAEQYEGLLGSLGDDTLRQIATWKLEGYTNAEIAGKLGCVTRTVERKLEMIRERWHRRA